MNKVSTLYTSFEELELDFLVYGHLLSAQDVGDKESYKNMLFDEYVKSHPLPSTKLKDLEITSTVSKEFHVTYEKELELSQGETLLSWDSNYDNEVDGDYVNLYNEDNLREFTSTVIKHEWSQDERDALILGLNLDYIQDSVEDFTGDIRLVEMVQGTVNANSSGYSNTPSDDTDEDDLFDFEDSEDEDEEDAEDSDYEEDEEDEEDYEDDEDDEDDDEELVDFEDSIAEDSSESEGEDFSDNSLLVDSFEPSLADIEVELAPEPRPKPMSLDTQVSGIVYTDLVHFLKLNPKSTVSEAQKYFSNKEISKYIRIGKVIKRKDRLYL